MAITKNKKDISSTSLFSEGTSFESDSDRNISDFEDDRIEDYNFYFPLVISNQLEEEKKKHLGSLKNLIENRKVYLDNLETLNNWISGQSDKPSQDTIQYTKDLLDTFKTWLFANKNIRVPKIIMGPIPTGGITVEFRPDSQNGMFISIHNNKKLGIDIMEEEAYHSVYIEQFTENPFILEAYEYMVNEKL